jgi:hypothetical protein
MRTVSPRLAAGFVAACLVLSGCGGNPKPQPLPRPTASLSPSATPSPPVMPAAARAKTRAGAIAFARGFFDAVNYAGRTGDTKPLRRLYIPFCTRCEALADGIDKTYKAGGYYDGGDWVPTRFKFYAIKDDVAILDALVTYEAQSWVPAAGKPARHFRASKNNLKAFNLRWSEAVWRTSALDPNK